MKDRHLLVDVALDRLHADKVVVNGEFLDVATGRIRKDVNIAIKGARIAKIGNVDDTIGPETKVIDATGMTVTPGLVDSHYHIESSRLSPRRHAQLTLPYGTTSLFEGSHELANCLGLDGIKYFLDEAKDLPQRIYIALSSATPPTPFERTGGYIGGVEAREALQWENVAGIGEIMDYTNLFGHEERLWEVMKAGLEAGKLLEGHGTPLPPEADAFMATGITSTHFSGDPERALELLARGCFLEVKGRDSQDAIRGLVDAGIDWQMVGICVDDRPAELTRKIGLLDYEMRKVMEAGLDPITTYQLATINNARHWHLEHDIGLVAPGRYADMLFISDLEKIKIDKVFTGGEMVAEKGKLTVDISIPPAPAYVRHSIKIPKPLIAEDFRVKSPYNRDTVNAAVLPARYFSDDLAPITTTLPVKDGIVQRDLSRDINKIAIVNRHGKGLGVSFWKVGYQRGAVATSVLHDSHNISVIGANDADMAAAVNRVAEIEGGIVVVDDGKVMAEISLPIGGIMTDRPLDEVVAALDKINMEADKLEPGELGDHPVDSQTFIFLTCFPWGIVLTDLGLYNARTGEKIPAVW
ncbi:MAG: amidohydrolase family protein [Candidatus Bathyarchaeota archaeon]|nr:amidohydrolase family protein [Candidatus Bathyarchaeota archaeon]